MLPVFVAALAAVAAEPAAVDAHRREVEAFRAAREARMRGDEGWLTVAGLHWLKEGETAFGSAPGAELRLPSGPARAGVLRLAGGKVTVQVAPGAAATVGGQPVTTRELRSDRAGAPDVLALGRLRLFVIERSGRLAVRLRDLDAPARKAFKGLRWYPFKPEYRVTARFVPHPAPRRLKMVTVLGTTEELESPGAVVFELHGRELWIEALLETPEARELYLVFRDGTSGRQTYGAGRFLYTELPRDGRVTVDFNRAFTPPCAFTKFATCILPPRGNHLPVRIEAGELDDAVVH